MAPPRLLPIKGRVIMMASHAVIVKHSFTVCIFFLEGTEYLYKPYKLYPICQYISYLLCVAHGSILLWSTFFSSLLASRVGPKPSALLRKNTLAYVGFICKWWCLERKKNPVMTETDDCLCTVLVLQDLNIVWVKSYPPIEPDIY
jgi:hypothetical protein